MATAANPTVTTARDPSRQYRTIATPEGVALTVELAPRGDRLGALMIDLLIIAGAIVALVLLLLFALAGSGGGNGWIISFVLLAAFLLRSFYFSFFELRWQGSTPGKRRLGLKVIDRNGGPLRADAVFARNLMREVEVFMPISLLFALEGDGWVNLLALVWALVFALLPFFNKDRLRAGDIVAGTWVVLAPKATLFSDLADPKAARPAAAAGGGIAFTAEQLAIYGIYELQTLETVLRGTGPHILETQEAVAARIQRKIGWTDPAAGGGGGRTNPRAFLEAFYAALRQHLETRMLFGVRRENKHDRR